MIETAEIKDLLLKLMEAMKNISVSLRLLLNRQRKVGQSQKYFLHESYSDSELDLSSSLTQRQMHIEMMSSCKKQQSKGPGKQDLAAK